MQALPQATPVRLRSPVPYDIWAAVVAFADFYTLAAISLVCKELKHEAAKHLWRSFTLRVDPSFDDIWGRRHLEEGCAIILTERRYLRVQNIRIDIQSALGAELEPEVDKTLRTIFHTLHHCSSLRSLSITSAHHRTKIARSLSLQPFAFTKLQHFSTDLFCDENLHGFWGRHQQLTYIELRAVDPGISNVPSPLPSLEGIYASLAHHTAVIPGSPVKSVHISGLWEGECTLLMHNLEQSTSPGGIQHLSMEIFDTEVTAHPYTSIIANLPHLKSLSVTHGDMADRDDRAAAINALCQLQELEVFEWGGGSAAGQADIFAACSKNCKSLRQISFRWGNYFQRKFVRDSEHAAWGIVRQ
ncbi:uncharacterized protein EI90DRAFT_3291351 [Cantharellus anzutake]|uniref:uncharacterized protein n=1 Tax=Cantharellus anzutake TaxID=1750568 RepID=UPI001905D032|nr:uncharacterized protein EI90DRAFT_3291351 [Cantharellus anzutake]KAF8326662.1 hypothetical protein EI90DRAFT_3291351 [Cantharellus anzutake]